MPLEYGKKITFWKNKVHIFCNTWKNQIFLLFNSTGQENKLLQKPCKFGQSLQTKTKNLKIIFFWLQAFQKDWKSGKQIVAKTLKIWATLAKMLSIYFFMFHLVTDFLKCIAHYSWMTGKQKNRLLQKPCKFEQAVH